MPLRPLPSSWLPLAACMLLAACDAAGPQQASPPLPALAGGDGRIEWRGVLPCADCEGIDTRLVLVREGDARRYELVETFIAEEGAARFAETGRWQQEGALIGLEDDTGIARRYAVLDGGGLQPRDARGRAFTQRDDDVLLPVEAFAP